MKHILQKETPDLASEEYESPSMEVIEMDIEAPILQVSGEDSTDQTW